MRVRENCAVSGNGQSGLSLIEVVVAFIILSLGIGALIGGLSTGLRGTGRAAEAEHVLIYAETLLAETGVSVPLEVGRTDGTTPSGLAWRRVVRPFPGDPVAGVRAFEVTVSVIPDSGGAPVALTTLILSDRWGHER